jgi:hypothetical protein
MVDSRLCSKSICLFHIPACPTENTDEPGPFAPLLRNCCFLHIPCLAFPSYFMKENVTIFYIEIIFIKDQVIFIISSRKAQCIVNEVGKTKAKWSF